MKEQDLKVVYPYESQMKMQMDQILEKGLQPKVTWSDRVKELLIGPGLSVIFYRSKLIFAGSLLIYLFLVYFCDFIGNFVTHKEYFAILTFPMLHLIFHMLSYWSEEQDAIIELKGSLHYSFQYIVSLRMFYVSILSAALNLILMGGFTPFYQMGKVSMIGLSSLFLFAVLTLELCEKINGLQPVIISSGVWALLCIFFSVYGDKISFFLFEIVPLIVHILMFLFSFGLFIYYFGKVGNKYANACEY